MIIVFIGVDGSGKTTLIDKTTEWIKGIKPGTIVDYFHFCPVPRFNKKGATSVSDPHGKPPYNIFVNLVKDVFLMWNFYKGGKHIKALSNAGHVVIVDRYYYDILVDSMRYRLLPLKYRETLIKAITPPDMVFYCVGDAEKIYNRKKETSVEKINVHQQNIYRLKEMLGKVTKWIKVDTTVNDIEASFDIIKNNIR